MDITTPDALQTLAEPSTATKVRPSPTRLSPRTALLLAVWLGLCAGYLDVGIIVLKRFTLNPEGSFRAARDFPWTVPLGHVALLLIPSSLLLLANRRWPNRITLSLCAWLLATLASWGALARVSLYLTGSVLLAVGLGALFRDAVRVFGFSLRQRWVRNSLLAYLGLLILLFGLTTGRQALRESQAVAGLPPSAPKARNVVLIVWDTVRASSLSAYGHRRQTTPNLDRWAQKGVIHHQALAPRPGPTPLTPAS